MERLENIMSALTLLMENKKKACSRRGLTECIVIIRRTRGHCDFY